MEMKIRMRGWVGSLETCAIGQVDERGAMRSEEIDIDDPSASVRKGERSWCREILVRSLSPLGCFVIAPTKIKILA